MQIKRITDFIVALLALGILIVPICFIYIVVKVGIGGSAFFRQKRVGKDECIFTIYKFKTMRDTRDIQGNLLPDAERMTKLGEFLRKTSVDELPQLINIIKGDMSFIGPRPLLVSYLDHYTDYQRLRHNVLPGLSGYAQVNGRNAISWADKFELDIFYVKHLSCKLDLKILLLTINKVIFRENISESGQATMTEFVENHQQHDAKE
ncbi:sugar transferase [Listeria rocourtiae]|nr:sugar transferase [Listeria rocourtiae]MBC1604553.1 sugar transferase [Listeria rocourtiae]